LDTDTLYTLGVAFTIIGIIIVVATALLILLTKTKGQEKTDAAGIIMVGPIPIIFGTSKEAIKTVLILAIILTTVLVILTIASHLLTK
jgi:uncharacterized protein (TIGR00304 family)